MRIAILILALFILGCSEENVTARFGTIDISERVGEHGLKFRFGQETNRVPLLTMKEGGLYGIEYRVEGSDSYEIQLTAITPPHVIVGGGDLESVERSDEAVKFVFETRKVQGSHIEPLMFSAGDPPGIYKLQVSVNGDPFKTIEYQAYVPNSAH